jgi:hypothetical protein
VYVTAAVAAVYLRVALMRSSAGEKQRLSFSRVSVEVRKLLAILASQQHRSGGRQCARFETAKPAVRERQPVAALGELALVDDVDANRALLIDNPAYG